MSYFDQETKISILSGCFSSLEYRPYAHVRQYDQIRYMYVDILELRDIIGYNGQLLVATLANQIKDYIKDDMIYNGNWHSYYIKLYKGSSPDSFKLFVKYNQIIGSRFIGEYPISDLLSIIEKV